MMPEAVILEISQAGVAAVFAVPHLVRLAARRGLVAAAQRVFAYSLRALGGRGLM